MTQETDDLVRRRKQLDDLLAEQWEYTLEHNPEFASILGDKRWNDRISDFSDQEIERQHEDSKQFLARFEAVDTAGFPEQEVLNRRLMIEQLRHSIEDHRFRSWQMPVNQISGVHLDYPQLVSVFEFSSARDYDDFTARLRQLPRLLEQTVEQMRKGMDSGLMPPRFLLEKVADQCDAFARHTAGESPFSQPLRKFPESVPDADRGRIREQMTAAITDDVLPAYARFASFVRNDYAPHGRMEVGSWSLPEGDERYAVLVQRSTTTELAPEEIHRLGLAEVARIESEMRAVGERLGHADLTSLNQAIEASPELRAKSRQHILDLYRKYIGQMYEKLPLLFGRLPKAKVEVMPVEEFRERQAPGAQYMQGTPDGSRPGHVLVNTHSPESRKIISVEATAYHEGVPGHHMQISIAQELPELPPFRQQGSYTAYVEGWALYSERLGKEVGFYEDPWSDYGRLQDEMLRAIRLVVDTGLHYKRWNRQQVVDFFHAHSAVDEVEVQNETDRYIVWPAQALGYKIGQLGILKLRERAKDAMGGRFDIREFHDEVLVAGALPMNILEERIEAWIAKNR